MKTLADYRGTLPYASELFGVYQPLLGWRSRRIKDRYEKFRAKLYERIAARAFKSIKPRVRVQIGPVSGDHKTPFLTGGDVQIRQLEPVAFLSRPQHYVAPSIDSAVARLLERQMQLEVDQNWPAFLTRKRVTAALQQVKQIVLNSTELDDNPEIANYVQRYIGRSGKAADRQVILQRFFERESVIAGYLLFLKEHNAAVLNNLFVKHSKFDLLDVIQIEDPLLNFGNNEYDAVLSPIGIVHLYREYFFEFDSFLGPPVGHVWLSPGGTVELIEINTRRTITERSVETFVETITRTETAVTSQDELADAVRDENQSNIKFGFSNVASYTTPVFQDTATVSLSLDSSKAHTRETAQKHMRQQSEKLSSEIKKNYKTTFRTSTEVTDTTSKRYVLQNTSDKLVNYELRRKMRKVGVQVQDIGVQLCWHTFVDDPGRDLGIARLVHVAQPAELTDLPQPDQAPMPQVISQDVAINIPFVGIDNDDTDNAYTDGAETEVGWAADEEDLIEPDFPQAVTCSQPGYTLARVTLDSQGADAELTVTNLSSVAGSSTGSFTVHLAYVHWHDQSSIAIKATLIWEPGQALKEAATAETLSREQLYTEEKARRFKEAFYKAARERIDAASRISPRPASDLREEERTVVYRALISQLMRVGVHESQHIISELVRSIFDVDKMLYFVAPEWWATRLHHTTQNLGAEVREAENPTAPNVAGGGNFYPFGSPGSIDPAVVSGLMKVLGIRPSPIPEEHVVDWGGGKETGRDSYYITESSEPAHFGSSLGWLLQLDGDNLRNAFLNSPWVKAIIPIRPGKEHEAMNWLQQAQVEGADGLDAVYVASPGDPVELQSTPAHEVTVAEALDFLIGRIGTFNRKARTVIQPNPADPADPRNQFAGSLPPESIFEHGFDPLAGGVRFNGDGTEQILFAQWMEILPTDQVVALQVEYDPKTLQVRTPADEGDGVADEQEVHAHT